jgi:hypothetical protein
MRAIRDRFFPGVTIAEPMAKPPRYDLRSVHDMLLGGRNGYHLDAASVWDEMAAFLARSS